MAAPCLDPGQEAFWESREPAILANPRDPAAVAAASRIGERRDSGDSGSEGLVCFLTSGSTGHPKIVGFTREALLASARAVNAFLGIDSDDIWLRVLPVFHVGGFQVAARAWAAGARVVSPDEAWDPGAFVRLCAGHGVTRASLVPTQVHDLALAGARAPGSLRTVLVGGGELRPALFERALSLGWPVRASYGLTEAASTVAIQAESEPSCSRLTVLPHWDADLAEDGTLQLRGPSLPRRIGTWDAAAGGYAWADFQPPLATRDRVRLSGRSLVFDGRADRVIKRLGELVDLSVAERALADAALAGGAFGRVRLIAEPDARDGHRLVLECLDANEGAAVAALFDEGQPPFARLSGIRTVPCLRLSPLGKPVGPGPADSVPAAS